MSILLHLSILTIKQDNLYYSETELLEEMRGLDLKESLSLTSRVTGKINLQISGKVRVGTERI